MGISTTDTEAKLSNTEKYIVLFSDFWISNKEYEDDSHVQNGSKKPLFTLAAQKFPFTLTEISNKSIDPPFMENRTFSMISVD